MMKSFALPALFALAHAVELETATKACVEAVTAVATEATNQVVTQVKADVATEIGVEAKAT